MNLLLDTHAFIWLDGVPSRLPYKIRAACADRANELYLSLVSVWELQIKLQLGKLTLRSDIPTVLRDQQQVNQLRLLDIELSDILELSALPEHHRDSFGRLIISQARRRGFNLATQDGLFRIFNGIGVMPRRSSPP